MAWTIEWTDRAVRSLRRLSPESRGAVIRYMRDRIASDSDARRHGKALVGEMAGFWRYRVGDYRVICRIEDGRLTILVVEVGHRRDIYRGH